MISERSGLVIRGQDETHFGILSPESVPDGSDDRNRTAAGERRLLLLLLKHCESSTLSVGSSTVRFVLNAVDSPYFNLSTISRIIPA